MSELKALTTSEYACLCVYESYTREQIVGSPEILMCYKVGKKLNTKGYNSINHCVTRAEPKQEECSCCEGVGILEDIDGNKGACMTCNGKGYFKYPDKKLTAKEEEYKEYEFCEAEYCCEFKNNKCRAGKFACVLSAKFFHMYLKENNYKIIKRG